MDSSRILRFDPNETTNIKLVWSLDDLSSLENGYNESSSNNNNNDKSKAIAFKPEYSHQIFKEEQIIGYEPLRLNIYMGAGSLTTFIDTNYTIKSKNITNVEKQLLNVMSKTDPPKPSIDSFKEYIEEKEKSFRPPGNKIYEYSTRDKETGEERIFEIYYGKITDPAILRYHELLQIFVLWYIDGSSYIHTEDSNWDIFLVFERKLIDGEKRYGAVGYSTIYNFYHHPSTTRSRISQFLILPIYQRMGLGKQLLNSIYNHYKSNPSVYGPVYDITVEDPADYFILLRNSVDLDNIVKSGLVKDITGEFNLSENHSELLERIRSQLLVTPVQAKTILEIYVLSKLINRPTNDPLYKRYRIFIKKKLYKQFFGSDVEGAAAAENEVEDTPEKKKEIEEGKKKVIIELYDQLEQDYSQSIYSNNLIGNR